MWIYLQINTPCAFIVPAVTYMTDNISRTKQRQNTKQKAAESVVLKTK